MRNFEIDQQANEEDFIWAIESFLKRVLIVGYLALFGITLYILVYVEAEVQCYANDTDNIPVYVTNSSESDVADMTFRFRTILLVF